jgi:hypothetical protein
MLTSIDQKELPKDRSFGALFAIIFCILGISAIHKHSHIELISMFFGLSAVFLFFTLVRPQILSPFNKAWFLLGILLGKIVSPIVLGAIFFVILTPVAVIGRMFGRDALRLNKADVKSYWVDREPVGPSPESFKNQF